MNEESDEDQLKFAVSQGRAVVINNLRDFAELHRQYAEKDRQHYGIVLTTKCSLSVMIRRLRNLLDMLPREKLINQIRWLNEFDRHPENR